MRSEAVRIRVPESLKKKIAERAMDEGRTVSNCVESLIKEYMEKPSMAKFKISSEPKTSDITLNTSPEFKKKIGIYAEKENRTISNYIVFILQSEFGG